MNRTLISALALACSIAPVASLAGTTLEAPRTISLRVGQTNMVRISAVTRRHRLSVTGNTCFSRPAAAHDILNLQYEGTSSNSEATVMAIDVRWKNAGTCTITFSDGAYSATTTVDVRK